MKPQFPGILHSSRFSPISEVNNHFHSEVFRKSQFYSNDEYIINKVSTPLFYTEFIYILQYKFIFLSTKEIYPSIKNRPHKILEIWTFSYSSSKVTRNKGARGLLERDFTAKANTFPPISIFWAGGDRTLNRATWKLENIFHFSMQNFWSLYWSIYGPRLFWIKRKLSLKAPYEP